jgi:putative aldouronate transport system substrate-binding protein
MNGGGRHMRKGKFLKGSLVVLTALLTLTTACSSEPSASEQSSGGSDGGQQAANGKYFPLKKKETLKLTACQHSLSGPFKDMSFFKMYEEMTNVHIEWNDISNAQCKEQMNLIYASNNLPDAFYGTIALNVNDVIKYGSQGMLIPLEKYINKGMMPNLYDVLEKHPEIKRMITAPDGHIYSLPVIRELLLWQSPDTMFINKVWLDKLGLKVPQTTEEFYRVLKEFKTKDPNGNGQADEIPFTFIFNNDTSGIGSLFGAFGRADWTKHVFIENGKVVFSASQPEYKEAIKYFQKFYAEGLFDQESLAQDNRQLVAKGSGGKDVTVGGYFAWNDFNVPGVERAKNYVAVPALEGPTGKKVWRKAAWNNNGVIPTGFAITAVNKHPELTMRWVDQSYGDDMTVRAGWGDMVEKTASGKYIFKEAPQGTNLEEVSRKQAPGDAPLAMLREDYGTLVEDRPNDLLKNQIIEKNYLPYMTSETFPGIMFTAEENKVISSRQTDINNYILQTSSNWLIKGGIDAEWDSYLAELKKMKLDELIEVYQKAYNRYMSVK